MYVHVHIVWGCSLSVVEVQDRHLTAFLIDTAIGLDRYFIVYLLLFDLFDQLIVISSLIYWLTAWPVEWCLPICQMEFSGWSINLFIDRLVDHLTGWLLLSFGWFYWWTDWVVSWLLRIQLNYSLRLINFASLWWLFAAISCASGLTRLILSPWIQAGDSLWFCLGSRSIVLMLINLFLVELLLNCIV